jgi:NADH-quinone oxidoreductase subunit L
LVIHAMHARIHDTDASQDVNNMGGLKKYLPWTHLTFLVSVLAIAGLPFTSGFFSKDEILYSAYTRSVVSANPNAFVWPAWTGTVLFVAGVTGAVMTAFYMFRVYFLTFHGEFKGWQIVPGWQGGHDEHGAHAHAHDEASDDHGQDHALHDHALHDHADGPSDHGHGALGAVHGDAAHEHAAHHGHQPGQPLQGPEPHESPWQMTLPLMILAVLAAFGGFLNAHPFLHLVPLDHWLEPVFASTVDAARLHTSDPDEALVNLLLVPGVLAFLVGTGLAYVVYLQRKGAPERSLAARFPGLYQLVFDKWRVDELYDELVVGSLEALAEASVWIDRWVVDGILARLTALVVTVWGHLLRLFQTGHAQAYAAVMVLGLFGLGWFVTVPQPEAAVSGDAATGQYAVQAAPGLGYSYRWDADGDGNFDTEQFGAFGQVTLTLEEGASRSVHLQVRNAFGRVREGTFSVSRPKHDSSMPTAGAELPLPGRTALRTTVPGGGMLGGRIPSALPGAGTPGGAQ